MMGKNSLDYHRNLNKLLSDPVHVVNVILPSNQTISSASVVKDEMPKVDTETEESNISDFRAKISHNASNKIDLLEEKLINLQLLTRKKMQDGLDLESETLVPIETRELPDSIKELKETYKSIPDLSQQAQKTVESLTNRLRSLDNAKKNLVESVSVSRTVIMLIGVVARLRDMVIIGHSEARGNRTSDIYDDNLESSLEMVFDLSKKLEKYKSITEINTILVESSELALRIEKRLLWDFEDSMNKVVGDIGRSSELDLYTEIDILKRTCRIIEVMPFKIREYLLNWFVDLLLKDYASLFGLEGSLGDTSQTSDSALLIKVHTESYDSISRRFSWFKRSMKKMEECGLFSIKSSGSKIATGVFPPSWKAVTHCGDAFCHLVSKDIAQNLDIIHSGLTSKNFLVGLFSCIEFEAWLTSKCKHHGEENSSYYSTISRVFQPYLNIYMNSELRNFEKRLDSFFVPAGTTSGRDGAVNALTNIISSSSSSSPKKPDSHQTSENTVQNGVFTVSSDLVLLYRQMLGTLDKICMHRLGVDSFSWDKSYIELAEMFGAGLETLRLRLSLKLSREEKSSGEEDSRLKQICHVLLTSDYCENVTVQLQARINEKLDLNDANSQSIDFSKEKDAFMMTTTSAIQSLVHVLLESIKKIFSQVSKISWSNMSSVGDQSSYVADFSNFLKQRIVVIRDIIGTTEDRNWHSGGLNRSVKSTKYFRWFCDKFADQFVIMYWNIIYSCKPINEIGAEQLLLDTHSVKLILREMPSLGADQKFVVSGGFANLVVNGMEKVETFLKVVLTPLDPPEIFIKNFFILYGTPLVQEWKQKNAQSINKAQVLRDAFLKVLEMKNVKKSEQSALLKMLVSKIEGETGLAVSEIKQTHIDDKQTIGTSSIQSVQNSNFGKLWNGPRHWTNIFSPNQEK